MAYFVSVADVQKKNVIDSLYFIEVHLTCYQYLQISSAFKLNVAMILDMLGRFDRPFFPQKFTNIFSFKDFCQVHVVDQMLGNRFQCTASRLPSQR